MKAFTCPVIGVVGVIGGVIFITIMFGAIYPTIEASLEEAEYCQCIDNPRSCHAFYNTCKYREANLTACMNRASFYKRPNTCSTLS